MTERRLTYSDGHPDLEWLGALHDGELSDAEAREVETHAAGCESCRQTLADLAALSRLTPDLEPTLPGAAYWPGLTERIVSRVAEERSGRDAAPVLAAKSSRATVGEEALASGLPVGVRSNRGSAWRWLLPLAAVCGVALQSWRLLLSGSSMMGEVGSPAPRHASHPIASEPARSPDAAPSPPQVSREAEGKAKDERADFDMADAADRLRAEEISSPAVPAPVLKQAVEESPAVKSAPSAAAAAPAEVVADLTRPEATSLGAEAEEDAADAPRAAANAGMLSGPEGRYRELLAAGTSLDSVLARAGREADSLWACLLPDPGRATVEAESRQAKSPQAQAAGRALAPGVLAAPPDSATLDCAIAVEEVRLSLLLQYRPDIDRTRIESRLGALRKMKEKQEP